MEPKNGLSRSVGETVLFYISSGFSVHYDRDEGSRIKCQRGVKRFFIQKKKAPVKTRSLFGLCSFSSFLQVNGRFFAFFSLTLSNGKHFFGGLGQSPEDESDGQYEK